MSSKNNKSKSAPKSQHVVIIAQGANADVLNGRVACRTNAMHQILSDAYSANEALSYNELVARTRDLIGAAHRAYAKLDRTAHSHLNTMRRRLFVEHANGAWRLTALGAREIGASFVSDFAHDAKQAEAQAQAKSKAIAASAAPVVAKKK